MRWTSPISTTSLALRLTFSNAFLKRRIADALVRFAMVRAVVELTSEPGCHCGNLIRAARLVERCYDFSTDRGVRWASAGAGAAGVDAEPSAVCVGGRFLREPPPGISVGDPDQRGQYGHGQISWRAWSRGERRWWRATTIRRSYYSALEPVLAKIKAATGRALLAPTLADVLASHGLEYTAIGVGTSGNAYVHNPNADGVGGATIHPEFTLPYPLHESSRLQIRSVALRETSPNYAAFRPRGRES